MTFDWGIGTWEGLSWMVTGIAVFMFLLKLHKPAAAFSWFILSVVFFQMCLGPALYYAHFNESALAQIWKIEMQVDVNTYFSFVFPGAIAFAAALMLAQRNSRPIPFDLKSPVMRQRAAAWFLIALGGMSSMLINFTTELPSGLGFLVILMHQLLPCGLIYLHVVVLKKRSLSGPLSRRNLISWPILIFAAWLLLLAIRTGMFGAIIFWGLVAVAHTFEIRSVGILKRFVLFGIAGLLVMSIQLAKTNYRAEAWGAGNAGVSSFITSLETGWASFSDETESDAIWFGLLTRANQGWIMSHVMNTCDSERIEEGWERIGTTLAASVIPRAIWPDKPEAGGKENIQRYTAIKLQAKTSMNISYFGDFYVAFGTFGGILGLAVFGYAMGMLLNWLMRIRHKQPLFFIAYPIVIIGLLQVETDLTMLANHALKSIAFLIIFELTAPRPTAALQRTS